MDFTHFRGRELLPINKDLARAEVRSCSFFLCVVSEKIPNPAIFVRIYRTSTKSFQVAAVTPGVEVYHARDKIDLTRDPVILPAKQAIMIKL